MKKLLSCLSIFISSTVFAQINNCSNALTITPDSLCVAGTSQLTGQTLTGATNVAGDLGTTTSACTFVASPDVWFKFVARTKYPTITISSLGSGWGTSLKLQLLQGACNAFTEVACANNGPITPALTNPLTPGTTYYIRVHRDNTTSPAPANLGFSICVTDPLEKGNRMNEVFVQTVLSPATVLQYPWEVTYGPDDSLWITESKGYRVYKMSANTGVKRMVLDIRQSSTFLPAAERTPFNCQFSNGTGAQGGLAGLALHPDFLSGNNSVYISYIYSQTSATVFTNKLVMFTYDVATGLLKTPVALCDTLRGSNDHNSQRMIIAPITPGGIKYLFYASGDMGAGQGSNITRPMKAQLTNSYEGKILRFNLTQDADAGALDKWIPSTVADPNPYNAMLGVQSAVWCIGQRNNQGFAYDADLNILYGTSHGAYSDDELNIIEGFKNYGHPLIMGYVADGNYDGNLTSGTNTSYSAGAPFSTGSGISTCPPIGAEATRRTAIDASGNGLYKDPIFSAYPTTGITPVPDYTGSGSPKNIWATTGGANAGWPSEGWSGIGLYKDKMIPGWYKSIIAGGLKWGRVIKLKLDATGTKTLPSNLGGVGNTTDTVTYFQSVNRYRDIAFGPNGKDIFLVLDNNAATSGPGTNNPIVAACAGCVVKYSFLGYQAATAAPGLSLIPKTVAVTDGVVNTCNSGTTVTIDGSNNFLWVPITGPDGNIMAEINANGNNLGTVTSSFYKKSGGIRVTGGLHYLDRNITITPEFQPTLPAGSPLVKIRLYISKAEYDALDADGLSGVSAITDLRILKNGDACGAAIATNTTLVTPTNTILTDLQHGANGYVLQGNITGFSSFYFGTSNMTLPLQLITFSGYYINRATLLKWETEAERNMDYFIVERNSGNGFQPIGNVTAGLNTNSRSFYNLTDNDVANLGVTSIQYRLKMVEKDGSFAYSGIVNISLSGLITKISVFPNPVNTGEARVNISTLTEGLVHWKLMDNSGRVVLNNTQQLYRGTNNMTINVSTLPSGMYYLNVSGSGLEQTVKLQRL